MATGEFYVVYIKRKPDATHEQVKTTMDRAVDWYRINETLWVLYSTSDTEKWYARLSPHVKDGGNVFICKLNIADRQGWMDKDFWSWIRREKKET